jgi:hypothetical protein
LGFRWFGQLWGVFPNYYVLDYFSFLFFHQSLTRVPAHCSLLVAGCGRVGEGWRVDGHHTEKRHPILLSYDQSTVFHIWDSNDNILGDRHSFAVEEC